MLNVAFSILGWASGLWMGTLVLVFIWTLTHHLATLGLSLLDQTMPSQRARQAHRLWSPRPDGHDKSLQAPDLAGRIGSNSPALGGLRIVQLSDIHMGPTLGRSFMRSLVTRTNALTPA